MNQKRGLNRFSTLPDDGDHWAPNNLLTPEQKKNTSRTPVGQATDKKLRPQPTKMNSFKSGPSYSLYQIISGESSHLEDVMAAT